MRLCAFVSMCASSIFYDIMDEVFIIEGLSVLISVLIALFVFTVIKGE